MPTCRPPRSLGGGRDLRLWFLRRHENSSKSHKAAVRQMLGFADESAGVPPQHEFQNILESARKGTSCSDKIQLIHWCLHECAIRRDRQAFAQAETMSLRRDARKARLLVRYGLAASSFESCAGVVGMAKGFGETAASLVQATRHILTEFFTEYAHPPRWYSGPAAKFDAAAFKSACKRVELMMTDAASNEMVAGQVSRGRRDVYVESDALAGAKHLLYFHG